ncbi:hypothetical protein Hanom_Chr08g00753101 [Helianthus anomalus]
MFLGAEELKPKKFFVQHADTVSSSDVAILAKNARFKQIWKSRKGTDTAAASDDALHDMCRLYDVERVDVGETSAVHEQEDEEDLGRMYSFLPLFQEFVPSAAEEIEPDIDNHMIKQSLQTFYLCSLIGKNIIF